YMPTVTGCGHASIYAGTVPAIHGIVGNNWIEKRENKMVYCSEDKSVKGVGTTRSNGQMSPRYMLTTSICDELKLATNFRSKVIGIAMKDRGSILPAGHSADAAYWYEAASGNWISSSLYMDSLPEWVKDFNEKNYPDRYYQNGWNTLYDISTYKQSTADIQEYEARPLGKDQSGFPYDLKRFSGNNYDAILKTPYGNNFTLDLAKQAIQYEQMGADSITDFLAISFSSPDYIGHSFGPNSIEIEDTYIRLDQELGYFFEYLDKVVGKGNYLSFLTADHGVAHVPAFLQQHKIPAGILDDNVLKDTLNRYLKEKFGAEQLVSYILNYQVYLNHKMIDSMDISKDEVIKNVTALLMKEEGIDRVLEMDEVMEIALPEKMRELIVNGWHPARSGDIQLTLKPGWIDGGKTGTTHGLWNPYDSRIPLLFYGWNIPQGSTTEEVFMSDIAATVSALLKIQQPSGCIGKSLVPSMNKK
ncbi:MAG: alkaline phosphatase PafA, partial [Bacteroidota bacterium]